jgi:hypothetical protein
MFATDKNQIHTDKTNTINFSPFICVHLISICG